MRAATYTQGAGFAIADVPRPAAAAGELLLRIRATAICGTDLKIVNGGHRKLANGQRIVLGHELAGEVADVGEGVTGFRPGDRVGVAPNAGCGGCPTCRRGESNYCASYTAFGIDRDGAHAPFLSVPAVFLAQGNVVPLPDDVSDVDAALLEPLSCVVNGIQSVSVGEGDRVLIYGVGPMGLLHVMACRAAGAARVFAADPQARRLEQAVRLGAEVGIRPGAEDVAARVKDLTDGEGVDVIITACPVPAVQAGALPLLATHGRLCLFGGLPKGSGPIAFDTNDIHYRHLTVTGATGGSPAQYRAALRLVREGKVRPAAVVSDTVPLDDLETAYGRAMAGAAGKVVMVAR